MGDESGSEASRSLSELRVVELRAELELRGQDVKGKKAELLSRLRAAMEAEGLDPDTHRFSCQFPPPLSCCYFVHACLSPCWVDAQPRHICANEFQKRPSSLFASRKSENED